MPEFKKLRHVYGFDDVALVPGDVTVNPDQTDISFSIGQHTFAIPVLASAMDAVADPAFAVALHKLGGLAVLNLEGVQTRYDDPGEALARIIQAPAERATSMLQKIYAVPIKENLIGDRIRQIKAGGAVCAVAVTPTNTKRYAPLLVEAGADILVVQSTVTTARHISKSYRGLIFSELVETVPLPIIVGNCVSHRTAYELMETGIHGILVGVGPGAACTSREVLGVGVPQVTATMDCAAARDDYLKATGRYVAIITDGGMRTGGDITKAIASGADAVMLGSTFAHVREAPGQGFSWGMATFHSALPRGTRIKVGQKGSLEQILFGPSSVSDGTQNLMGALRTALGVCGARTVKEMQRTEMVIAPAIKTEGKLYQLSGLG